MAEPTPKQPRKLWRALFALSLALNVAVVGVVAGFAMRDRVGGTQPRGFDLSLGPIGRALDKEDRRAIGDALRRNPALRRDGRAASETLRDDFAAALRATPFSPDALEETLKNAGSQTERIQSAARAALVARIADMTAGERSALADRIEDTRMRRRDRK